MLLATGGRDDYKYISSTEVLVWWKTVVLAELEGSCWRIYGIQNGGRQTELKLLHNQVAVYSAGSPLVWIEVEGGELPTPRIDLRATVVNNVLYITGGSEEDKRLTSVLSWDPAGQTWQEVGNLTVARDQHAAVAVPTSFIDCM